jgi:hypothetical protein
MSGSTLASEGGLPPVRSAEISLAVTFWGLALPKQPDLLGQITAAMNGSACLAFPFPAAGMIDARSP